jgi:tetratricopeptide (TPR) repeat protein
LPPPLAVVNSHRHLRGPYTAVGTLLRTIVPAALDHNPELVIAHNIEILSTAPELGEMVPATRETLTSLAVPKERTRYYSRLRTLRITHGLVEFLGDYLRDLDKGPHALVIDNVHQADPTDREFLAVLVRRIDPDLLTVVATTGIESLTEPPGPIAVPLEPALNAHCIQIDRACTNSRRVDSASLLERAQAYVDSDGTSDHQEEVEAYGQLDADQRARLHDSRATELEARGEPSLRLGAIPYHREHGSDPAGAGVAALLHAEGCCIDLGYYHAAVDFGVRGRAVTSHDVSPEQWWNLTTRMTTSLAALGRAEETFPIYDHARALTTSPVRHMRTAYATSMLYTRHLDTDQRDHLLARAWINQAIAFASLLPDRKERAFNTVFNRNGLALIEVHVGDLAAALRLLDDSLAQLDRELDPDEHALHRSVLRYNRAQVRAGLGRHDEAVDDYTAVIALDPNYAEYHFDRAALYRRLGKNDDALADYDEAIRLSPPFPEAYYNRGDLRSDLGDTAGAVADFTYVLELDPDFIDAYVNRAGIHLDRGDPAAALRDAEAGLARSPDNPLLHVVVGQAHAERGEHIAAMAAFDQAVARDPDLITALAGRAALACEKGQLDLAIAHLRHAVDLAPEDTMLRYNRAFAYQRNGQWERALADLDVALRLAPDDPDVIAARDICLRNVAAA